MSIGRVLGRRLARMLPSLVLFAVVSQASAQEREQEQEQEGWHWSAEIYGWMPTISGTTASGTSADLDFDSILGDLSLTAMGNIEAERGQWTLFADFIYLDIDDSVQGALDLGSGPISGELDWESRTFIVHGGIAYEVAAADHYRVNLLGGVRYLRMKTDLDLTVGTSSFSLSDTEAYYDGILGVESRAYLNDRWYLAGYADVGTGDSDVTWQALAAVGYRLERFDLLGGYRYLDWQFDGGPLDELTVDGPYVGVRISF